MVTISFPNWSDALAAADLPDKVRGRHRIIINWFLGHLKRERRPASKESARQFIDYLVETRRPADWQVEQWTDGLNWFFREAPKRRRVAEKPAAVERAPAAVGAADGQEGQDGQIADAGTIAQEGQIGRSAFPGGEAAEAAGTADAVDGRREYAFTVSQVQDQVPIDPWYEETVRLMRVRHMAYRTEETYLGWIRRMERFFDNKEGLEAFGEADLKRFLSYLAVEEGVAAGTQRQALNAGVFFLREVRKIQLGDFSDYVKANPRKYYPVVYSKGDRVKDFVRVKDSVPRDSVSRDNCFLHSQPCSTFTSYSLN